MEGFEAAGIFQQNFAVFRVQTKRRVSGIGRDGFRNRVLAPHCKAAQLFHHCLRNLTQLEVLLAQILPMTSWSLNILQRGFRLEG